MKRYPWIAAVIVLLDPGPARALVGDTDGAFGLDGSIRTLALGSYTSMVGWEEQVRNLRQRAANLDPALLASGPRRSDRVGSLNQTTLRLTASGYGSDWLHYEAHVLGTFVGSSHPIADIDGAGRYRSRRLATTRPRQSRAQGTVGIDRLNLRLMLAGADITVGRQAITFGKAQFWNPLDVFNTFSPTEFDRDYKVGVDALRLDVPVGDFSGLTFLGVIGDVGDLSEDALEPLYYRSAFLARAFGNVAEWDVSAQAGHIHGGYLGGVGAAGDLEVVELRLEASYFWRQKHGTPAPEALALPAKPDHLLAAVGVGRLFQSSLFVSVEYLYNGAGAHRRDETLALAQSGEILHVNEHLLGGFVTYQLHPLVTASLAVVAGLNDPSAVLQPGLGVSLADEVDLVVGGILGLGERPRVSGCPATSAGESAIEAATLLPACGALLSAPEFKSEFGGNHVGYLQIKAHF